MIIDIYNGFKKTLTRTECDCWNTTPQPCCQVTFQRELKNDPANNVTVRQVVWKTVRNV